MHNPVQIVLNAQHYINRVDPLPGGGNKDFFEGLDDDFKKHKQNLVEELQSLSVEKSFNEDPLIYARVELQSSAWAKSHRPTTQMFPTNKIRTMSGNELGSLIVELKKSDIAAIQEKVLSAEDETNWVINEKTKKLESKPRRIRSEVGAITHIQLYSSSDRRKFSIEQAMKWLNDPRTGNSYYIETFFSEKAWDKNNDHERAELAQKMMADFHKKLKSLKVPIEVSMVNTEWTPNALLVIKMIREGGASIQDHQALINFLDQQQIVRTIILPPILQSANSLGKAEYPISLVSPELDNLPVVGIIDTGVADVSNLTSWKVGGADFLDEEDQELSHGTFIAGLIAGGSDLNSTNELNEKSCKFYDLGLHPAHTAYASYYPRGFLDFLEQLDEEISIAVKSGVRIFNMSLSVELPVEDNSYSLFANVLDQISDKYDIIFVLPTGNLTEVTLRKPWPSTDDDCLKLLAEYRHQGKDKVYQPAESLRSITVGAVDPICPLGHLRPSRYTRKGPGPSYGVKPDVVHVGGRYEANSGLFSISNNGELFQDCGTSFASPLVAKTLAALDHSIEGRIEREALSALLIHNARIPSWLESKKLSKIAKDFVGAGLPQNSSQSLMVYDNEITMVFSGMLSQRQKMIFDFSWPACLVNDAGKCRGKAKLTTVYRPPINRDNGAEFVLVNIDSWLRQEDIHPTTKKITFKNRLVSENSDYGLEKERITEGVKWWPVNKAEKIFPRGIGSSSQWRLVIEPLARSGYVIEEPIPFSVVLTISDHTNTENVFNAVRSQFQASGVQISDIRTALQSRLRPNTRG
ncbi:S8 family peptidase [Acinetobacter baumannii]|uniref:S8 family peptidase n=2 Tax=Acinetobacter baumannii TaxID=470 RepID=UPI0002B99E1D|nr:S8 family peptidase [Acinetobacter baumannii]EHZ7972452.1 S8 family peptidase [Acinetobacter baumannii]EIO2227074.1 S8 family peptidase [Acinetobacter baumannii]EKU0974072.1 S8 family peptidase [Acinetobacter baumannii]EKU4297006.1 S8 family peptidase [Acinetobacter baumannii]EKU4351742.1 S8 family peptidase [Acinetobacter baumannii]